MVLFWFCDGQEPPPIAFRKPVSHVPFNNDYETIMLDFYTYESFPATCYLHLWCFISSLRLPCGPEFVLPSTIQISRTFLRQINIMVVHLPTSACSAVYAPYLRGIAQQTR